MPPTIAPDKENLHPAQLKTTHRVDRLPLTTFNRSPLHAVPSVPTLSRASSAVHPTFADHNLLAQDRAPGDPRPDTTHPQTSPSTTPSAPSNEVFWPDLDHITQAEVDAQLGNARGRLASLSTTLYSCASSEYAHEILKYLREVEFETMVNPNYMAGQSEITWKTRRRLVDWLIHVHSSYQMRSETLCTAINLIDRFLALRVVARNKLRLVAVTAILIAAKYEEITPPSLQDFMVVSDDLYTRADLIEGERIILRTVDYRVSPAWTSCAWLRYIYHPPTDYDVRTLFLSEFLAELTLLDERFLRARPSLVAAAAAYSASLMLGSPWDDALICNSGFPAPILHPGHQFLVEQLTQPQLDRSHVFDKYSAHRFNEIAIFARDWALRHQALTTSLPHTVPTTQAASTSSPVS